MKNFYFIITALFMAMLVSCSSGVRVKEITPTSTEFTDGELAEYIEVVDQPCELSFYETDEHMPTQYFRLKVTLRMKKDGFKNVDARDISFQGWWSASINLVDNNGYEVLNNLTVKSDEFSKLKKLLTGSEGDTEEIVFEERFIDHVDAPKYFKQASKFTPKYTCYKINIESSSSAEKKSKVLTKGSEETSNKIFSDTDNPDWNELLDSYEQYVDKYISYLKKASKGDLTAISEYPALMQKAQEFDNKIRNVKSDMSASQLARYNKISMKMLEAAQNLNE